MRGLNPQMDPSVSKEAQLELIPWRPMAPKVAHPHGENHAFAILLITITTVLYIFLCSID